jgi:hypothetical protein
MSIQKPCDTFVENKVERRGDDYLVDNNEIAMSGKNFHGVWFPCLAALRQFLK